MIYFGTVVVSCKNEKTEKWETKLLTCHVTADNDVDASTRSLRIFNIVSDNVVPKRIRVRKVA